MLDFLTRPSTSRYLLGILFLITGALHFVRPQPFLKIMPEFIPAQRAMVYLSGLAELAGGVGLMFMATQRWAGWGLIVLLIAVFPANINMTVQAVQHQGWHTFYTWATILRLPLQFILIWWVYWAALR